MPDDTGSSEILAYSVYWREDGSSRYVVVGGGGGGAGGGWFFLVKNHLY